MTDVAQVKGPRFDHRGQPAPVLLNDGRRIAATIVLLIFAIEGTFFHLGGWNQYARVSAAVAFVEPGTPYTGTFRIDGLKDDGERLATGDWAQSSSGFYSNKAPGISFLAVVPYFFLYHAERLSGRNPKTPALTQVNIWLLNLWLSVFWNAVAALALLRRLPRYGVHSREGAALVALVYSFATLVLPFACSPWGHPAAAAFITLGTLDVAEGSRARCFMGGLWLGLAVLTEYLAAVSLVAAAIFVLSGPDRSERLWKFLIGSAPPVGALLLYHELAFGNYFTTATSLASPTFLQPGKVVGLFGVPNPESLLRMLFAPGRGLFWQTPILLVCVFGIVSWYRSGRRAFLAFAVGSIAAYTVSLSGVAAYQGGQTTSMRYLIIALPFFCILLPDLYTFRYRKTFLLLFAVSAANVFILAATSTMFLTEYPLSEFAYPDFLKGRLGFNPVLAQLGVGGPVSGFAIAAIYASALAWLLWSVLTNRRLGSGDLRT
jgi:hypothetical protein